MPVGLVAITLLYAGFSAATHLLLPECLDEPCRTEGVDNSISMWAGDFFVALFIFLFGLHLKIYNSNARKSSILAQIFMSGSFTLMGIARWKYPNNASTDMLGLKEYWLVWAVSTAFFAFSACCHMSLSVESTVGVSKLHKPWCAGLLVRIWLAVVVISSLVNIVGCVWCYSSPSIHTDDLHDEEDDNLPFEEKDLCIQMVYASEFVMWLSYALLWVPVGLLLKCATRQNAGSFLWLPASAAAGLAVFFQCVASMVFVCVPFVAWVRPVMESDGDEVENLERETALELWNRIYGSEIFHYTILMTFCCAHTLSWVLTPLKKVRKVNPVTGESKYVTKSVLASAIDEAEKGLTSDDSDDDKATTSGTQSHREEEESNTEVVVESAQLHEPPPLNTQPATSAMKQTDEGSKRVSFR